MNRLDEPRDGSCARRGSQDSASTDEEEMVHTVGLPASLYIRVPYRCFQCGHINMLIPPGRDEPNPTHR